MLSKKDILEKAWLYQLEIWNREKEHLDRYPSKLAEIRERRAWDKLEELHTLLLEEV